MGLAILCQVDLSLLILVTIEIPAAAWKDVVGKDPCEVQRHIPHNRSRMDAG